MDALIVVDVQNDFCAGGALAVPDGDAVIEPINRLAREARFVVAAVKRQACNVNLVRPVIAQHPLLAMRNGPWKSCARREFECNRYLAGAHVRRPRPEQGSTRRRLDQLHLLLEARLARERSVDRAL